MNDTDVIILNIKKVYNGSIGQNISVVSSDDDSIDIVDNNRRCVIIRLSSNMVNAITNIDSFKNGVCNCNRTNCEIC